MKEKIEKWLSSKRSKSRWELQFEGTDLYLTDDCILAADVYDDFLIFRKLGYDLRATDLFSVGIDEFNEWGAKYCADRIINAL